MRRTQNPPEKNRRTSVKCDQRDESKSLSKSSKRPNQKDGQARVVSDPVKIKLLPKSPRKKPSRVKSDGKQKKPTTKLPSRVSTRPKDDQGKPKHSPKSPLKKYSCEPIIQKDRKLPSKEKAELCFIQKDRKLPVKEKEQESTPLFTDRLEVQPTRKAAVMEKLMKPDTNNQKPSSKPLANRKETESPAGVVSEPLEGKPQQPRKTSTSKQKRSRVKSDPKSEKLPEKDEEQESTLLLTECIEPRQSKEPLIKSKASKKPSSRRTSARPPKESSRNVSTPEQIKVKRPKKSSIKKHSRERSAVQKCEEQKSMKDQELESSPVWSDGKDNPPRRTSLKEKLMKPDDNKKPSSSKSPASRSPLPVSSSPKPSERPLAQSAENPNIAASTQNVAESRKELPPASAENVKRMPSSEEIAPKSVFLQATMATEEKKEYFASSKPTPNGPAPPAPKDDKSYYLDPAAIEPKKSGAANNDEDYFSAPKK